MTLPFALGIGAQVGFLVHQLAFLAPKMGLQTASYAVAVTTAMAVLGRLVVGAVIDRLNQRIVSAVSFVSQALALLALINTDNQSVIFLCCAVFGFSVGNLITLPSLIIFREFGATSFGTVYGIAGTVIQLTSAFGPALYGVARDLLGSYPPVLAIAAGLELAALAVILAGRNGRLRPADLG
jgi:cyanate permease